MTESARDEGQAPPAGWSQLTAINTAKMLTIVLLLVLAAVVGVKDMRQVVYLSLHISYCLWWLLEQWLFPERARQLFRERVGVVGFGFALLFIGVLYSLPGLLAFSQSRTDLPGRRGRGAGAVQLRQPDQRQRRCTENHR